jgi:hypothetical protein
MDKIRLFGLVLIITSLILGLAALATQTNQIRIQSFSLWPRHSKNPDQAYPVQGYPISVNPTVDGQPYLDGHAYDWRQQPTAWRDPTDQPIIWDHPATFVSIPVIFPLALAGFMGLLFWFTPQPRPTGLAGRGRRGRARRK